MPIEDLEIERPRPAPLKLRKLAAEAKMEPRDFLAELLKRHASFESAASEVGIRRETLRLWRRRYRINVRTGND